MAQRILVIEESGPVAAALRRHLEGAGFRVDVGLPGEAAEVLEPGAFAVAVVRPEVARGAPFLEDLKRVDPGLPVVLLFHDEEEAAAEELSADGLLVAPLSRPVVVSLCRAMARVHAQSLRIAELEKQQGMRPTAAGIYDYEFFKKLLLMEIKRSKRYRYPVSLSLFAVDRWKEISARMAGRARAALLGELLRMIAATVRDIDLPLLYNEERLLVFMPHTSARGAVEVARRVVQRVRSHPADLTVSAGVATFDGEGTMSFSSLVRAASEALLRAQGMGGDRAEHAGGRVRRDRISMG
ncbi:MAG TPA: diguanylate cyclase [Anaeromyxobacteraceae bacterium]|nr:diguanylate cyclase [Anaeromyxobacteraceae bacterium]